MANRLLVFSRLEARWHLGEHAYGLTQATARADGPRPWNIQVSMSRTGNCYDNAVMERFFGTLKDECVSRYVFETREQARGAIFEYITCFYNRIRRHSSLDYLSPLQFELLKS